MMETSERVLLHLRTRILSEDSNAQTYRKDDFVIEDSSNCEDGIAHEDIYLQGVLMPWNKWTML